jgi:hypothetical protein
MMRKFEAKRNGGKPALGKKGNIRIDLEETGCQA